MRFEKITRDEPLEKFDAAVAHLRELHGCSRASAMSMAAGSCPDLLRKYNEEGRDCVVKVAADTEKVRRTPEAVQRWNLFVAGIMERDKISRVVAMQRARRENPEAYAAFQAA